MATRVQKVKVGVFLLVSSAIIGICLAVVLGLRATEGIRYWIEFDESVLGLYEGGMVEYKGVPVGKVKDIAVTPSDTARVEIEVDPDSVTLHEGVQAQLVMYSLATGTMAISLSGSDPAKPELAPESEIPPTPSVVASFMSEFPGLMDEIRAILRQIAVGLEGMEEGRLVQVVENVDGTITEARSLLASINEKVDVVFNDVQPAVADLETTMAEIRGTAEKIGALAEAAQEQVEPLQLAETEKKLQETIEGMNRIITRTESVVAGFDGAGEQILHEVNNMEFTLREGVQTFIDTLRAIRRVAEMIQEDPSALLRGPSNRGAAQ